MGTINLTGYVVVHGREIPRTATLGNVRLPDGMPPPKGGLTLLYGFQDTRAELSRQRLEAEEAGLHVLVVKVTIDVGEIPAGRISLKDLPGIKFLHLNRATADLENLINQKWSRYIPANASQRDLDRALPYRYNQFLIGRPDLMQNLHDEPEFAHLDAMVYRVMGDPHSASGGPHRVVGTLFRATNVKSIECLDAPVEISLPANLPRD